VEPGAQLAEIHRPILRSADAPIPADLALWTVRRPVLTALPRANGAATVNPLEAATLRLDRLTSIAQSATPAAFEGSSEDGLNWFIPRANELREAQRAVNALSSQTLDVNSPPSLVRVGDDPATLALHRSAAWIADVEAMAGAPQQDETQGRGGDWPPN